MKNTKVSDRAVKALEQEIGAGVKLLSTDELIGWQRGLYTVQQMKGFLAEKLPYEVETILTKNGYDVQISRDVISVASGDPYVVTFDEILEVTEGLVEPWQMDRSNQSRQFSIITITV